MPTAASLHSTFATLLASSPGPTAIELSEVAIKRPRLYHSAIDAIMTHSYEDVVKATALVKIMHAYPKHRDALWDKVKSLVGTNHHQRFSPLLLEVVIHFEGKPRSEAWTILEPAIYPVMANRVLAEVPELQDAAWRARKRNGHYNQSGHPEYDLTKVIKDLNDTQAREAWGLIIAESRGVATHVHLQELYRLVCHEPRLAELAFARIVALYPPSAMVVIFYRCPHFRESAWQRMLAEVPGEPFSAIKTLVTVVRNSDAPQELRDRAWNAVKANPNARTTGLFNPPGECSGRISAFGIITEATTGAIQIEAFGLHCADASLTELGQYLNHADIREAAWSKIARRTDTPPKFLLDWKVSSRPTFQERALRLSLLLSPAIDELAEAANIAMRNKLPQIAEEAITALVASSDVDRVNTALVELLRRTDKATMPLVIPHIISRRVPLTAGDILHVKQYGNTHHKVTKGLHMNETSDVLAKLVT